MAHDTTNWEDCAPRTANVSIGTYSLSLSCFGQPRTQGQAVIIIIPGIASSIKEWPVVVRGVSQLARTYTYDRSGFGESDVSPCNPTAEQSASELSTLLVQAGIAPPFVLVCHSFGGIIAREFLHIRGEDVGGVVFVDANTAETPLTYPNPVVQTMQRGLDTLQVTIGQDHKLSPQEWSILQAEEASPKNFEAGRRELKFYHESGRALMTKKQIALEPPLLGDRPVAVLHANYALDLAKILEAGSALGNGTAEERQDMAHFVANANEIEAKMQRKMLGLSTNTQFVHVHDSGHYMHMVRPDVVIEMVQWVLDEHRRKRSADS